MQVQRRRLQQKFGDAAIDYDRRAQFQHVQTRRVLDAARMLLPEAATLLDVGCGTGYFAYEARESRPDWKIIGVDIAQGMCEVANTRCTALNADAALLPLADTSIDGAVSALCYQWVENQRAAFTELARVMKPNARAIIASLGGETLYELGDCAKQVNLPLGLLPMQRFSSSREALEAAGFTILMQEKHLETLYYPTVGALVDSMRAIGAGNNFVSEEFGFIGPKRWAAMLMAYEKLRTPEGIPARWEHHFFVVSKPA